MSTELPQNSCINHQVVPASDMGIPYVHLHFRWLLMMTG